MICVENDTTPTWGDLIISVDWGAHWANALTIYLIDSLWLSLSGTSFQLLICSPRQGRETAKGGVKDFIFPILFVHKQIQSVDFIV